MSGVPVRAIRLIRRVEASSSSSKPKAEGRLDVWRVLGPYEGA